MLDRFEQFSSGISAIYRYIQKIERDEMERNGMKGGLAQYLAILIQYPEGLTAAQLCEISDRDKAAVSRSVSEMESKGLLRRIVGENAYRARLVLTDSGKQAAQFVCRRIDTAVELAAIGLKDADRAVFYAALELFARNLQTICREGLPEYNI